MFYGQEYFEKSEGFQKSFFYDCLCFRFFICSSFLRRNRSKNRRGGEANPSETKEFIVSGTFSLEGAVPSEIASLFRDEKEKVSGNEEFSEVKNIRTAVPSVPELSGLFFNVTATKSASSSVPVSGEVLRGKSPSFTVKLSEGEWTLIADAFSDSGKTKKVLSGMSAKFSLSSASPVKNDISIILSPVNEGSGKVSLPMGWTIDSGIRSVKITFEDLNGITKTLGTNVTDKDFEGTLEFDSDIQSGSHTAKLEFYAEAGGVGTFRYSTHEVINVFQNLTTDTWQGNAPYFTETGGKTEFKVTKELVDAFNLTTFYVKGEGSSNLPSGKEASDTNTGTAFDPFKTVQAAVDKVVRLNDGASSYKIYVDGTVTRNTSETCKNNAFVSISPDDNLNLAIEGLYSSDGNSRSTIKAVKDVSSPCSVFYIGSDSSSRINITIKNLAITNGYLLNAPSVNGAGINLAKGKLTLSNVAVRDNQAVGTSKGAGIYVGQNADLTLDGNSEVKNNTANDDGGGIYVDSGGGLTISGATITGNTSHGYGGGIYIKNSKSVSFTSAIITSNSLTNSIGSSDGGGIYLAEESELLVTGGLIANNGRNGIFVGENATLGLGGNILIGSTVSGAAKVFDIYLSSSDDNNNWGIIKVISRISVSDAQKMVIYKKTCDVGTAAEPSQGISERPADIIIDDGTSDSSLSQTDLNFFQVCDSNDKTYNLKLNEIGGKKYGILVNQN